MKLVWLLSVPVIALVALFAVRSAPTFAGPACADNCGGAIADQTIGNDYAFFNRYEQVAGQYCRDKTNGMVFIATGAPIEPGLTCGGAAAPATASATATATGTAAAAGTATGSATATATGTPR